MSVNEKDNFKEQRECTFEGEVYSVRDNGAVLRHPKIKGRKRAADNIWTFGKENNQNPYLCISGVRIHRIVATAFHGESPGSYYVVDHIDTNCRNNRPENLRWLTRLENALKNPVTRKKIEFLCGSIDAFLENPKILNTSKCDTNISWMKTVSPEEAQNCKMRMELWANSVNSRKSKSYDINYRKSFSNRVLKPLQKWEAGLKGEPGLDFSQTPWCGQYMWGIEVYFPCCPKEFGNNPMNEYFKNIQKGKIFAYNDSNTFPKLIVYKASILDNNLSSIVICERDDSNWTVVGILLNKQRHFIHFNLGSFSTLDEAGRFSTTIKDEKTFWSKGYSCNWNPI